MDNNTVSLRRRHKGNMGEFQYKKLLKDLQIEINKKEYINKQEER